MSLNGFQVSAVNVSKDPNPSAGVMLVPSTFTGW